MLKRPEERACAIITAQQPKGHDALSRLPPMSSTTLTAAPPEKAHPPPMTTATTAAV
jgi:hypothetical protein